jgi:hypothetical protein
VPDSAVFASVLEEELPAKALDAQPLSITTLQTNTPKGYGNIALPGEGSLWVEFSYLGPVAAEAWLWDQAKLFTPIPPNKPIVLPTHKGDRLVYKLAAPDQQITLKWGYE